MNAQARSLDGFSTPTRSTTRRSRSASRSGANRLNRRRQHDRQRIQVRADPADQEFGLGRSEQTQLDSAQDGRDRALVGSGDPRDRTVLRIGSIGAMRVGPSVG